VQDWTKAHQEVSRRHEFEPRPRLGGFVVHKAALRQFPPSTSVSRFQATAPYSPTASVV
jgi:hypothetical protein